MEKLKKIKFDRTFFINTALIVVLVVFFALLYLNAEALNFFINGYTHAIGKPLQVYYLDVGQASASLIIFPNDKSMIIDTGSVESQEKFLKSVDRILNENKIKKVDILLLSHSDEDHVGGAVALLKKYEVGKILRPKLFSTSEKEGENTENFKMIYTDIYSKTITAVYEERNAEVVFIEDDKFSMGSTEVEIFACKNATYSNTNSFCPFVTVEDYGKVFMFTSDATSVREKELYGNGFNKKVDFLQVAHHGSKSSTTERFLNVVQPSYAFISAGDSTHPAMEVLQRLQDVGVSEIYCTKTDGILAVAIENDDKFLIVCTTEYFDFPLVIVLFSVFIFSCMRLNIDFSKDKTIKKFRRQKFF